MHHKFTTRRNKKLGKRETNKTFRKLKTSITKVSGRLLGRIGYGSGPHKGDFPE